MVSLALPIVAVQVGTQAMGLVDTIMVGHMSAHVLAAVALGNLYFFNVVIFGTGVLMALDPVVSQAVGAGDHAGVSRAVQRGLVLAVLLSAFSIALMAPAGPVLRFFRQPADILDDTRRYLLISIAGVLPYFVFVVMRQTLQATSRVTPIVATLVLANASNAGLNWVFVYGHLGSPALGAAGSAIATAVSRWAMAFMLAALTWPQLRGYLRRVSPSVRSATAVWGMLRLGAPIGGQQMLEVGAFGAIGLLMGALGTIQMAAHQIAITLASLTFMVPVGVGSAAAVRVGHAIGAGDRRRASAAVHAAYVCGVGFMACTGALFLLAPRVLALAFTSDARVVALAMVLIPIAGVFQIFDGAQAVGAGVLRGAGDTTAPLVVMLGAYWLLGVPVSAYLGLRTHWGPAGLWFGFVLSLACVAVFLLARIRVVFRRGLSRVMLDGTPPAA
jgi:MATE family multidrug resistance protein